MKKLSEKATAALIREDLQVINTDVWLGIQDAKQLRCELYWLDEYEEPITVEVPLYRLRQAYNKVGHSCVINLICPDYVFIPSAIEIGNNGVVTLENLCEDLVLKGGLNGEVMSNDTCIITRDEYIEVTDRILATID